MKSGYVATASVLVVLAIALLAASSQVSFYNTPLGLGLACIGVPFLIVGLVLLAIGLFAFPPASPSMSMRSYLVPAPANDSVHPRPPPPQTVEPGEVVTDEIGTREIIKVRCRNCGALAEAGANNCPSCAAPIR